LQDHLYALLLNFCSRTIEVLKLDFNAHSAQQIFSTELPGVFSHASGPVMSDPFLGLYVEGRGRNEDRPKGILVIDWQKGRFVLLPGKFIHKVFGYFSCNIGIPVDQTPVISSRTSISFADA
jgi:hypothetical protein